MAAPDHHWLVATQPKLTLPVEIELDVLALMRWQASPALFLSLLALASSSREIGTPTHSISCVYALSCQLYHSRSLYR